MKRFGRKFLAWAPALGLVLTLAGLFVATGESLRRQERHAPLRDAVQSEQAQQENCATEANVDPGLAACVTP